MNSAFPVNIRISFQRTWIDPQKPTSDPSVPRPIPLTLICAEIALTDVPGHREIRIKIRQHLVYLKLSILGRHWSALFILPIFYYTSVDGYLQPLAIKRIQKPSWMLFHLAPFYGRLEPYSTYSAHLQPFGPSKRDRNRSPTRLMSDWLSKVASIMKATSARAFIVHNE